jgi:acyl-homoserine-lactone acylase
LGYRYGSTIRPVIVKPVTVRVRQANGSLADRSFDTLRTHHGPIVRSEGGRWVAYAILDNPVAALEQSFLRTKARNLKEFMAVAERRANSSNNTLFADKSGTIAYLHPQFVPLRDNRFDFTRPVDGSNPATDWKGLHTVASLPNVINPRSGYVFNSNDAPWPTAGRGTMNSANYPRYMDQWGWNARTDHALLVLNEERAFTIDKLVAAAYDRRQPGFDLLLPGLFAAFDWLPANDVRRRRLAEPVAALRSWDRRWSGDSIAQTLGVHWGEAMWKEASKGVRGRNTAEVYARMKGLAPDRKLAALGSALDLLQRDFGGWKVKWGDINRFQRNDGAIVQTFDDRKPSIAVPFPSADWGSLASFGARTYPGTVKRYGTSGNSFVAVVEFGKDGPRAVAVTAGGVNGDPRSPHFLDQAQAYADGRLQPVHFAPADVKAHAREIYRPGQRR